MARILSQYSATVVIAALSLLLAGRAAGLEPAAKCQAKKAKLAAVYTACRINAAAQALKTGHPPDPFICDAHLARRWQRVEAKSAGACPTINDLAAMQNRLTLLSAAVVSSLKIEPKFCGDGPYPQCDGLCFPGQECRPGLVGSVFQFRACFCQSVPRRVFLTSTIYPAALGGLAGADTKCQMHAEEAGLTGTYKAWLSDSQDSPATRFLHSASPYVRVDGTLIALDWFDLTDGTLLAPISVDETGYEHSAQDPTETDFAVWTNTAANGSLETTIPAPPVSCSDWTNTQADAFVFAGAYLNPTAIWTRGPVRRSCAETHRLYCFQQ
jgi:hypothetical protein